MQKPKIKETEIWADMFQNPGDHLKAFNYVAVSIFCLVVIIAIRVLI